MSEQAVNETENPEELELENPEQKQEDNQPDPDGFEVIDSSDDTPTSSVPLPTYLKNKEKWKKREEKRKADAEALRQENELLRLQLEQRNQAKPQPVKPPTPDDFDSTEEYVEKLNEYIKTQGAEAAKSYLQQHQEEQQQRARVSSMEEQHDKALDEYYERAQRLKAPDFEAAEDAFRDTFGKDAALSLISSIDNSEAMVYALGKNPAKAQAFAQQLKTNPVAGLVALTKYANNLTLKPRSQPAPDPDEPEAGAAGGAVDMQKQLDNLRKRYQNGKIPMKDVIAFKREARQKGVALD